MAKPEPINITVSATTAVPWPPTLTDPTHTSNTEPGDIAFTTGVSAGDKVQFLTGGDVTAIAGIIETEGNLFSRNPSASNDWEGVIRGGATKGTIATYKILYNVAGTPPVDNPYKQDPQLIMK